MPLATKDPRSLLFGWPQNMQYAKDVGSWLQTPIGPMHRPLDVRHVRSTTVGSCGLPPVACLFMHGGLHVLQTNGHHDRSNFERKALELAECRST